MLINEIPKTIIKNFQFYDDLFIEETVDYLKNNVIPCRINVLSLFFKNILYLKLFSKKKSCKLYFSTLQNNPFLVFSTKKYKVKYIRNSFTDFLNKTLKDAEIIDILHESNSIIFIIKTLLKKNSILKFIFEIDTKYSNIILCNENSQIISAMNAGGNRNIKVGNIYSPLKPNKFNLKSSIDMNEITNKFNMVLNKINYPKKVWLAITQNYSYIHLLNSKVNLGTNVKAFIDSVKNIKKNGYFLYKINDSFFPSLISNKGKSFSSLESLYNEYIQKIIAIKFKITSEKLIKKIKKRIKNLNCLLTKLLKNRPCKEKAERFYQIGCSLLSMENKIINENSVKIINQFTGNEIEVQIDKGKTLVENGNLYFKKNKKEKSKIKNFKIQKNDIESRISYYNEIIFQINNEIDFEFIENIEKIIFKNFKIPKKTQYGNFKKFLIEDNGEKWQCYLSENAVQNEKLLSSIAKSEDFWFHSFEVPGGHLIIKNSQKKDSCPTSLVEKASSIAGKSSYFKNEDYATVAYTKVKYLSRPPKHPPGFVIMNKFKTIRVKI